MHTSLQLRLLAAAAIAGVLLPMGSAQTAPPSPGAGTTPGSSSAGRTPSAQTPSEALPQDTQDAADGRDGTSVLSSRQILGGEIVDTSGVRLGRIEDLVADDSGEIIAVVERAAGGGTVAYPLSRLRPSAADAVEVPASDPTFADGNAVPDSGDLSDAPLGPGRFSLLGDKESLTGAPQLPGAGNIDAVWVTEYRRHFELDSVRTPSGGEAGAPGRDGGSSGARADGSARRTAGGLIPWRLQQLGGSRLLDGQGRSLGTVDDFAIGFPEGRVNYVVIASEGGEEGQPRLQGVSLDELSRSADGRAFTTDIPAEELRDGRGIEGRRLPRQPTVGRGSRAEDPRTAGERSDGGGSRGGPGDSGGPRGGSGSGGSGGSGGGGPR